VIPRRAFDSAAVGEAAGDVDPGVVGARPESNVVRREVALELQVVINDLFEDVFLH